MQIGIGHVTHNGMLMAICSGAHLAASRCNVCRLRQPIGQVAGGLAEAIGSGGDRDINIPHYSRSCYLTRPERNKSKLNLTCRLNNNLQLSKVALCVLYDYESYDTVLVCVIYGMRSRTNDMSYSTDDGGVIYCTTLFVSASVFDFSLFTSDNK